MSVETKHPSYINVLPDWVQMTDTWRGERAIKTKREDYLPSTPGMTRLGFPTVDTDGWKMYEAYLKRAVFPNDVKEAVEIMVGLMHRKPALIELPDQLEPMRESATVEGETLDLLLRKINEAQLITGRLGLLLDAPTGKGPAEALPFIATYSAGAVINWDNGRREQGRQVLELVVLDESESERVTALDWEFTKKYRVLALNNLLPSTVGGEPDEVLAEPGRGVYQVAILRDKVDLAPSDFITPSIGGKSLDRIPFVFINVNDINSDPDFPPLLGLSNLALAIYRGEADYRQNLFLQGQDTLVVIGATKDDEDDDTQTGAGATIELPQGGDAKFIGVTATGLPEQRQALENDKAQTAEMGSRLIDSTKGQDASGEALRIRVAAKTPTLTSMALTGAAGLESLLKTAAEWVGADPEKVSVKPNLDFSDDEFLGRDLLDFVSAKMMGAPISLRTIHNNMKRRDVTDMEFQDELDEIDGEEPLGIGGPGAPGPEPSEGGGAT